MYFLKQRFFVEIEVQGRLTNIDLDAATLLLYNHEHDNLLSLARNPNDEIIFKIEPCAETRGGNFTRVVCRVEYRSSSAEPYAYSLRFAGRKEPYDMSARGLVQTYDDPNFGKCEGTTLWEPRLKANFIHG